MQPKKSNKEPKSFVPLKWKRSLSISLFICDASFILPSCQPCAHSEHKQLALYDAMEAYIDPTTGHAREYADFERAYKAKGYSTAQAKEIYRQDRQYTPFEERDADDLAAGQRAGE